MKEQQSFSELLQNNGHGIALRHPTQEINVGDICYWDEKGTATRILNVFENSDVHPRLGTGSMLMAVAQREQLAKA
jgi:hypothetical protein